MKSRCGRPRSPTVVVEDAIPEERALAGRTRIASLLGEN